MSLIAFFGVPGNLLCIVVQVKCMKSSTDYFILTMALFDLIGSAVNAPMFVIRNTEILKREFISTAFCMIHELLIYMTSVSTSLLLAALAINRYFLTCSPTSKLHRRLNTCVKEINIIISIFSVGVCVWIIIYGSYNAKTGTCESQKTVVLYLLKSVVMLLFIAMFLIACVCYFKVVRAVRNQHQKMAAIRQSNRVNNSLNETHRPVQRNSSFVQLKFTARKLFHWPPKIRPELDHERLKPAHDLTKPKCEHGTDSQRAEKSGPSHKDKSSDQSKGTVSNDESTKEDEPVSVQKERKAVNKITLMLCLITAVYITTWLMHWAYALTDSVKNEVFVGIMRSLKYTFMINCVINAVFYSIMSSKFRARVVSLFKRT